MKKLSLEMLRLSTNEILERSQMKKITGGYGGGCCYRTPEGAVFTGLSVGQAQSYYNSHAGQGQAAYCCASCGTGSFTWC
jgi:hypothetical protein